MKFITLTALAALAYDNGIVPTVTINRDGVAVRINEDEFDPETMTLFDAVAEPQVPLTVPQQVIDDAKAEGVAQVKAEVAPQLLVMKSGGKFFITDSMGTKVEGEAATTLGIDPTGYKTEALAQAALAAMTKQA